MAVLYLDYTLKNHALTGPFGPGMIYEQFRLDILTPSKDYKYFGRLAISPDVSEKTRGWLIDKSKSEVILAELEKHNIDVITVKYDLKTRKIRKTQQAKISRGKSKESLKRDRSNPLSDMIHL